MKTYYIIFKNNYSHIYNVIAGTIIDAETEAIKQAEKMYNIGYTHNDIALAAEKNLFLDLTKH